MITSIPLFGVYRVGAKRTGYRQDFCIHCQCPRLAWREKFWGFLHLAYIPILPIGRISGWACDSCNRPPRLQRIPISAWKILLALLAFIPMNIAFWFMPTEPDTAQTIWVSRILLSGGVIWLVWWITNEIRAPSWVRERAREATSVSLTACAKCGGGLVTTTPPHCPVCNLQRLEA